MVKINIADEIRRITNETAANAASKALEVAEQAKAKAAEVSTLAIAEALKAATLAATKAADAASAAAQIAASTSKDLEYIKKDISDTKNDIKAINEKLDIKYVSKEEFLPTKEMYNKLEDKFALKQELINHARIDVDTFTEIKLSLNKLITVDQFSTVRAVVYGMVGLILTSVMGGLMYLLLNAN